MADDICICGHSRMWHVLGHYSCNPMGVDCDCVEFQFAGNGIQETNYFCTKKYHKMLLDKGDTVCGLCKKVLHS